MPTLDAALVMSASDMPASDATLARLVWAAQRGLVQPVQHMLGALVDAAACVEKDFDSAVMRAIRQAVQLAVWNDWGGAVEEFVKRASDGLKCFQFGRVGTRTRWYRWSITDASAFHGSAVVANTLVRLKADVNRPLMWAAFTGQNDVARALLRHNASMEQDKEDGRTPLICAAASGHTSTVLLLLKHRADANARSINCNAGNAADAARNRGHVAIMRLLQALHT